MAAEIQIWHWMESGPGSSAFNMALDEALLETIAELKQPVLRFYQWTECAASFGYFQKHAEIERATLLRPLVRRPTGGGLVPHSSDWTYSVVFPPHHEWYLFTAEQSYRRMHEWIQAAFTRLEVKTVLAECCRKAHSDQCFIGYEKHDLLWQEQKIAGAAQRRTRSGLLIQGSVQPPLISISRKQWQNAMRETARESGVDWSDFEASGALRERADELAHQKYSQSTYNRKK